MFACLFVCLLGLLLFCLLACAAYSTIWHACWCAQKIPFLSKIDPKGKNVEIWMNEVESGMKAAFKKVLWDSIVEYLEIPRPEWIQKFPGQAVLNGSQLHWTKEIEDGVRSNGLQGVKDVRG